MQDIKIIDKGRHVYAFVEFTNIGDAEEAYREYNHHNILDYKERKFEAPILKLSMLLDPETREVYKRNNNI